MHAFCLIDNASVMYCQPESRSHTLRGSGVSIYAGVRRLNEEALQAHSVGALEIACDDACHDDLRVDADILR
jgi:hypothetical protein